MNNELVHVAFSDLLPDHTSSLKTLDTIFEFDRKRHRISTLFLSPQDVLAQLHIP